MQATIARKLPNAEHAFFGIDAKLMGNELMSFRHRRSLEGLMSFNRWAAISFCAITGNGEVSFR